MKTFMWRMRSGCVYVVSVAVAGLTGCTAPGYKLAPKSTPPPVLLNLVLTEPPIEAVLHTVIFYRGPGSWKKNAYWDEYVVTLANRGNALLTVNSVALRDTRNNKIDAGDNPWKLEEISRTAAQLSFGFAEGTVVQIGGGLGVVSAGAGMGAVFFGGGVGGSTLAAAAFGVLALPGFIGGTIYTNISNHNAIEREFARRHLNLPVDLAPGQFVQGSIFFPITPGPRLLNIDCKMSDETETFTIDLKPISDLHLKQSLSRETPFDASTKKP